MAKTIAQTAVRARASLGAVTQTRVHTPKMLRVYISYTLKSRTRVTHIRSFIHSVIHLLK